MFFWSGICLVFLLLLLLYFYSSLCIVILSDVSIRAVHSLISLFTLFQSIVLSCSVSCSLSSCPLHCPWLITQTCSLNWEQTETDNLFLFCHTFLIIHLFCFVLCRFFVFLRLSLVIRNNTSCSSLSLSTKIAFVFALSHLSLSVLTCVTFIIDILPEYELRANKCESFFEEYFKRFL